MLRTEPEDQRENDHSLILLGFPAAKYSRRDEVTATRLSGWVGQSRSSWMNTDLHELRDKQIGVDPCSSVVRTHVIKALPVDNDEDLVQALHEACLR